MIKRLNACLPNVNVMITTEFDRLSMFVVKVVCVVYVSRQREKTF